MKRSLAMLMAMVPLLLVGGSASAGTGYLVVEAYSASGSVSMGGVTDTSLGAGTGLGSIYDYDNDFSADITLTCMAETFDQSTGITTVRAEGTRGLGQYFLMQVTKDQQDAGKFGYLQTDPEPKMCTGWDLEMIDGSATIFHLLWV